MKNIAVVILGLFFQASSLLAGSENSVHLVLTGEVNTPQKVEVTPETPFLEFVSKGGGANLWANPRRVVVIRVKDSTGKDGEFSKVSHEFKEILIERGNNPSVKGLGLLDGDIVYICKKRIMEK